jgi:hypothetical protein
MQVIASRMQLARSIPDPDKSSQRPFPISRNPILILSFHLLLDLPSGTFLTSFRTKTPYTPHPHKCHMPRPSYSFDFITQTLFVKTTVHAASHFTQFSPVSVPSSLLGPTYSHTFSRLCFPWTGETKFHTYIKQAKKYFPFCTQNSHCH